MVTVKTKSIYDPVETEDGTRILVMRYWPRGLSKEKAQVYAYWFTLAPSKELLKAYRDGLISWEEFSSAYRKEMRDSDAYPLIDAIASGAFGDTITLLCWERGTEKCHRFILKELIEKASGGHET